ncbi:MAG: ABC transporter permease [Treponema sp.]|nr:ABC transporter permease [Treponema sp.]
MKKFWILFITSRYIFKGRGNSPVLSVLGIAFGVFALIVIISVMNGFQLGFIESILEVSSYHLRLESFSQEKTEELQNYMLSIPGVRAAVPFKEFQAIARGRRTGQHAQHAVLVRGLNEDTLDNDSIMKSKLGFESGSFNISESGSILLGALLASRLGVGLFDNVTLYSITGLLSAEEDEGGIETFVVRGTFTTGYHEYDNSWAFININCVSLLEDDSELVLGVKIENRFQDKSILEQARRNMPAGEDVKLSSWRDYNRPFFGALRTEKLFMFILVGLIFIVVGLNIFQAQRRAVLQRREEIGLLRAIGGTQMSTRLIFVLDGAITGLSGSCLGLGLGLAVASNIQSFFTAIENIVNWVINLINIAANFLQLGFVGQFSIFSPSVFYIKEIPSRILPFEVMVIFLFGFLSALSAAWFASRKISKIQPAEVLRYE